MRHLLGHGGRGGPPETGQHRPHGPTLKAETLEEPRWSLVKDRILSPHKGFVCSMSNASGQLYQVRLPICIRDPEAGLLGALLGRGRGIMHRLQTKI